MVFGISFIGIVVAFALVRPSAAGKGESARVNAQALRAQVGESSATTPLLALTERRLNNVAAHLSGAFSQQVDIVHRHPRRRGSVGTTVVAQPGQYLGRAPLGGLRGPAPLGGFMGASGGLRKLWKLWAPLTRHASCLPPPEEEEARGR